MDNLDFSKLTDQELYCMMMLAEGQKDEDKIQEELYWLCIKEANRRTANGGMQNIQK